MASSRFKGWRAYQLSYQLAESIFRMTLTFPKEERYSLTDQIRRSSRSVCANLVESYGRRSYPRHFTAKLADSTSENFETQVWLDFSLSCGYIDISQHATYIAASEDIGRLLSYMMANPKNYTPKEPTD